MAKCITKCPHCDQNLEVENSWAGTEVSCPVCGKNFIIAFENAATAPSAKNNPPIDIHQTEIAQRRPKKEYFYGRLYITLARILAAIIILTTITAIVLTLIEPFSIRKKALKNLKEYSIPTIIEKQNKFSDNYINFAQLMLTANNAATEFEFPANISSIETSFNNNLLTEKETDQSIKAVELYQVKIQDTSLLMLQTFKKHTDKIEKLLIGGNAITFTFSSTSPKKKNANALRLTLGQDVDFYNIDPEDALNKLFFMLEMLNRSRTSNSKLAYGSEIEKIKREADFIDKTLNNKKRNITLANERKYQEENSVDQRVVGKDQYALEKKYLSAILAYIEILSNYENWKIYTESIQLKEMLKENHRKLREIADNMKANLKAAFISAGLTLLYGLFTAFLIMVFADYLTAHFDSAVSLKSLDRKIKIFFFLPLVSLFLLVGCGSSESPEKKLTESQETLRESAVKAIFADQISANYGSVIYGIPGKKLVLISGGEKAFSVQSCGDLKIVSIAPCFNVAVLACSSTATVGSFRENKNGDYSHEAVLTVYMSYDIYNTNSRIHKDGTPGVTFHFLVPNMPESSYEQWLRNRFNELPPHMPDHAAAINTVENQESTKSSEVKIFKVLFNTKTQNWELEREKTVQTLDIKPLPPAYSVANFNLDGTNFKKLSVNVSDKRSLLFIHKDDYEIVDKTVNYGLVKHNGVWKKRSIVEQTVKLQNTVNTWKGKDSVSMEDFKEMLKVIIESPEAENYTAAIELAEKDFINVFINGKKDTIVDKRKQLVYLLDFIKNDQYSTILNRQQLLEHCQKQIDKINDFLKNIQKDLAEIKKDLDDIIPNCNYSKLKTTFADRKPYFESKVFGHFLTNITKLVEIYNNNSLVIAELHKTRGKLGNYNLFQTCGDCDGRGKKNCQNCYNTGKCQECGGSGTKTVTRVRWGRRAEEYHEQAPCNPRCSHCRGQTVKCKYCYGSGNFVDKSSVEVALDTELKAFRDKIIEVENNASELIL